MSSGYGLGYEYLGASVFTRQKNGWPKDAFASRSGLGPGATIVVVVIRTSPSPASEVNDTSKH